MNLLRLSATIALGIVLFASPFLRYSAIGHAAIPHNDHEPRHGGQLGMVGDFHIEVVRRNGNVEAFVSNAVRKPLQPAWAKISFDGGPRQSMSWQRYRAVATDRSHATDIEIAIGFQDGRQAATTFDFREDE